jgi:hypothetical protein
MRNLKLSAGSGIDSGADILILQRARGYKRYYFLGGKLHHTSLASLKLVDARPYDLYGFYDNGNYYSFETDKSINKEGWKMKLSQLRDGLEKDNMSFIYSNALKSVIFGESEEDYSEGLYEYLMRKFNLPLKKEWMTYVKNQLIRERFAFDDVEIRANNPDATCSFNGKKFKLDGRRGIRMDTSLTEDNLIEILKKGVRYREISLTPSGKCMMPMVLTNLDSYRLQYGEQFVQNVRELIKPYYGLKGGVEESFLWGKKKLYKQQGAVVNAAADNFFHDREKSLWLIEQMGSGKSIQAISIVEQVFALRYLAEHGGTPEEAHAKEGNVNYRVIVMCPGHLVKKWKKEIEENIPYSKVWILESLADCEKIYQKGIARNGKEFYIVGKDIAKLGCTLEPAPYKLITRRRQSYECRCCGKSYSLESAQARIGDVCECRKDAPEEDKKKFRFRSLLDFRRVYGAEFKKETGLQCPACGELMRNSKDEPMMPWDFMNPTVFNEKCPCCGTSLWKPLVRNLNGEEKEERWHKISFFKNMKKKDRETGWVLKGYEADTYLQNGIITDGIEDSNPMKSRKWAPSRFIKEKLHGFFDFSIFDELHQYKGGGTAQGIAMHAIAKSSRQSIGLTGTIAGGFARDIFYSLWRLAPHIMRENGYTFAGECGEKKFTGKYGTTETKFSVSESGWSNKMSKGKKLGEPTPVPGISPDIFGEILMPICLFLDLTDMSNKLPDLKEQVVHVDMEDDVDMAYRETLARLKNEAGGPFISPLSSEMLNFSLLYPDLPMGYKEEIIHPKSGEVVCTTTKFDADRLYPKEEKMVNIINDELDEGRRVFVYLEFTKSGLAERLRKTICEYCGLLDEEVEILRSESPSAAKREEWIHKKAADGVKVVITNPKNVETGLDFIFEYNGVVYNYPTLIFYECGTSLFTLWQASRRHYRLNQTAECRTYYLCYGNTNQAKIVRLMAEKQIATSSIQGKFSMEGLTAMAQSVDPRLILMQNLMDAAAQKENDAEKASSIFAGLNEKTGIDESIYGPSETRLYSEVYGKDPAAKAEPVIDDFCSVIGNSTEDEAPIGEPEFEIPVAEAPVADENVESADDKDPFLAEFFEGFGVIPADEAKSLSEAAEVMRKRDKKKIASDQLSLFDLFVA